MQPGASNQSISPQYCFHKQQQPPVLGEELDIQATTAYKINSYKCISQQEAMMITGSSKATEISSNHCKQQQMNIHI
jgi:hypothetical protein